MRLASDWRRDVLKRIAGSGMGWQQGADAVETRGVPHVCVTVSCAGVEHSILAEEPNLEPRFKQENFSYNNIALTNLVSIKVCYCRVPMQRDAHTHIGTCAHMHAPHACMVH